MLFWAHSQRHFQLCISSNSCQQLNVSGHCATGSAGAILSTAKAAQQVRLNLNLSAGDWGVAGERDAARPGAEEEDPAEDGFEDFEDMETGQLASHTLECMHAFRPASSRSDLHTSAEAEQRNPKQTFLSSKPSCLMGHMMQMAVAGQARTQRCAVKSNTRKSCAFTEPSDLKQLTGSSIMLVQLGCMWQLLHSWYACSSCCSAGLHAAAAAQL